MIPDFISFVNIRVWPKFGSYSHNKREVMVRKNLAVIIIAIHLFIVVENKYSSKHYNIYNIER